MNTFPSSLPRSKFWCKYLHSHLLVQKYAKKQKETKCKIAQIMQQENAYTDQGDHNKKPNMRKVQTYTRHFFSHVAKFQKGSHKIRKVQRTFSNSLIQKMHNSSFSQQWEITRTPLRKNLKSKSLYKHSLFYFTREDSWNKHYQKF